MGKTITISANLIDCQAGEKNFHVVDVPVDMPMFGCVGVFVIQNQNHRGIFRLQELQGKVVMYRQLEPFRDSIGFSLVNIHTGTC